MSKFFVAPTVKRLVEKVLAVRPGERVLLLTDPTRPASITGDGLAWLLTRLIGPGSSTEKIFTRCCSFPSVPTHRANRTRP